MSKKKEGRPKRHAIFYNDSTVLKNRFPGECVKFVKYRRDAAVEIDVELNHYIHDTEGYRWKVADESRLIRLCYKREERP